ncbi:MAG: hydrogenase 4 subunit F [Candidatus Omnitrophota bacterium]
METLFIIAIPLFLIFVPLFCGCGKKIGLLNFFGHFAVALLSLKLSYHFAIGGSPFFFFDFFYVDGLSAFFILVVSILNTAAALYSIDYMRYELDKGMISRKKFKSYYILFNLFSLSMFLVTMFNNMGMLWVAIEMTTLVSAFLVGFHNNKPSIEAAWKYIIICSVGITLALFGTILFYYTVSLHGGIRSINWTDMVGIAEKLDPTVVKIAFLFILAGYGTKAGLAPMHTWLPDAHSQALAPISALLSGVLLKTAIYAILRFSIIVNACLNTQYTGHLFMFFGILSLVVAAGFILVQKDIKRLMAYSSIEHIGIIALGVGFGGTLGLCGALFHVFNHAITKALMFFCAGNVVKRYNTSDMTIIKGVITVMPFTGIVMILGAFALAGSPPFSIFMSEFMILISGFRQGFYLVSGLFLFLIVIIFGALIHHFSKLVFGEKPADIHIAPEVLTDKTALVFLGIFVCTMGIWIPWIFSGLLTSAVKVLEGF